MSTWKFDLPPRHWHSVTLIIIHETINKNKSIIHMTSTYTHAVIQSWWSYVLHNAAYRSSMIAVWVGNDFRYLVWAYASLSIRSSLDLWQFATGVSYSCGRLHDRTVGIVGSLLSVIVDVWSQIDLLLSALVVWLQRWRVMMAVTIVVIRAVTGTATPTDIPATTNIRSTWRNINGETIMSYYWYWQMDSDRRCTCT